MILLLLILNISLTVVNCLDNGLALTPPMGFMTWDRFRCVVNCDLYPDDCISEKLIKELADTMVEDGYLSAGYEYIIIDDCWLAHNRTDDGRLQPDPKRFPSGIASLADYVHSLGLKFGIYEDYGTKTCGGYPGILGHLETDAKTFAEWQVDYLKIDGCYCDKATMEEGYIEFGRYLNETGRPIVYSCSFPAYKGLNANYSIAAQYCNLYRNYGDIDDSWRTVRAIMDWFAKHQAFLTKYTGPGHWNDPDMLIVGSSGLSYEQSKAQMIVWSILPAPLLISVDIRTLDEPSREILLNKEAIRINQDPLGIPGYKHSRVKDIDIWMKRIQLDCKKHLGYAVGFVSRRTDGYPYRLEVTLKSLGLNNAKGYQLIDIFEAQEEPVFVNKTVVARVKPTGGVFYKLIPIL